MRYIVVQFSSVMWASCTILPEFLGLGPDEFAQRRRGHRPRHDPLDAELVGNGRTPQRRPQHVRQPRQDRLRRAGGDEQGEPVEQLVAGEPGRAFASGATSGSCGMRSRDVTATARMRPSCISAARARLEKLMVTTPPATSVTAGADPDRARAARSIPAIRFISAPQDAGRPHPPPSPSRRAIACRNCPTSAPPERRRAGSPATSCSTGSPCSSPPARRADPGAAVGRAGVGVCGVLPLRQAQRPGDRGAADDTPALREFVRPRPRNSAGSCRTPHITLENDDDVPHHILVQGFPGKAVCHGGLGWSTIALLRSAMHTILIDVGTSTSASRWKATRPRTGRSGRRHDVVLTHAHYDHSVNFVLFPHATVWSGAEELAWAASRPPGFDALPELYVDALDADPRVRRVTAGEEILPGLRALAAPGHTRRIARVPPDRQ